jgi:hypothetical protein
MKHHSSRPGRSRATAWLVVAAACATLGAGVPAAAQAGPGATSGLYSMTLTALTGPQGGSLTIAVAAASTVPVVELLTKVQVETFARDGKHSRDE